MKNSSFFAALASLAFASTVGAKAVDITQWEVANPLIDIAKNTNAIEVSRPNTSGYAYCPGIAAGSNATVEATIILNSNTATSQYATAGVSIRADLSNYWAMNLVEQPLPKRGHFFELCESLDGEWLSQRNLRQTTNYVAGTWQYGKPYKMRLTLAPSGVDGEIFDENGKTVFRKGFAFNAKSVRHGRPAINFSQFKVKFSDASAETSVPVVEKADIDFPAYERQHASSPVKGKKTGFFHVEQMEDGRWWTIDPQGDAMVVFGIDHVKYNGFWCEKLGYAPYAWKNKLKHTRESWKAETLDRLKSWGFNALGAGCDVALRHNGLIHTEFLSMGSVFADQGDELNIAPNLHRPCTAFPNVFSPKFAPWCRYVAKKKCAPLKNDPWLFGYFIDNELAWWGDGGRGLATGLFDTVMKKGSTHSAKQALADFLKARANGDLDGFNALWGTNLKDFSEILKLDNLPGDNSAQEDAKKAFVALCAEKYFRTAAEAIREEDPNHMVLGARIAGLGGASPVVWEVSGKYCDAITFNCYPTADLNRKAVYMNASATARSAEEAFTEYYNYVKRPMLVTEWSFPALDSGLPCFHGAGQRFRTQAERTEATSLFAKTMLALPFMLGYDYFMWLDQPPPGISLNFPEDSNYGLINEYGEPYKLITAALTQIQTNGVALRFAEPPRPVTGEERFFTPSELAATLRSSGANTEVKVEKNSLSVGDCANLRAMLCLNKSGSLRWFASNAIGETKTSAMNGLDVLDVEFANTQEKFSVVNRIYRRKNAPWFLVELRSIANNSDKDMRVVSSFFHLLPRFPVTTNPTAPNLWKGGTISACWFERTGEDRFAGLLAPREAGLSMHYFVNKNIHPDAWHKFPEELLLPAGAKYVPTEAIFTVCAAGKGGESEWNKMLEQLKKAWQ